MKKRSEFGVGKKSQKNRLKIGFGTVLASFWEGSGKVWGVSWALLGASWPFFGRSKSNFFLALVQDRLQEAFCIDFGSIWGRFWKVWGGFGECFGRFGGSFGTAGAHSLINKTPTLIREASQCAGVLPPVWLDGGVNGLKMGV